MAEEPRAIRLNRLSIWLSVLLGLIAMLLFSFLAIEDEAQNTASNVTGARILEVANRYKQYWHVNGEPERAVFDNNTVTFSEKGWVLPIKDGRVDCYYWLSILHPSISVFGNSNPTIVQINKNNGVECSYQFGQTQKIYLDIEKGQFSVRVRKLLD